MKGEGEEQEVEEGGVWSKHQELNSLRFLFFKLLNRDTQFGLMCVLVCTRCVLVCVGVCWCVLLCVGVYWPVGLWTSCLSGEHASHHTCVQTV